MLGWNAEWDIPLNEDGSHLEGLIAVSETGKFSNGTAQRNEDPEIFMGANFKWAKTRKAPARTVRG